MILWVLGIVVVVILLDVWCGMIVDGIYVVFEMLVLVMVVCLVEECCFLILDVMLLVGGVV